MYFRPAYYVVKSQTTSRVILQKSVGKDELYSFDGLHASNFIKESSTGVPYAFSIFLPSANSHVSNSCYVSSSLCGSL